jgi:hypothetical protein
MYFPKMLCQCLPDGSNILYFTTVFFSLTIFTADYETVVSNLIS